MFGISFVGHNCANVSLFVCLSFVISRVNTFFGVFVLLPHPIESTHLSVFWECLRVVIVGCVFGLCVWDPSKSGPRHTAQTFVCVLIVIFMVFWWSLWSVVFVVVQHGVWFGGCGLGVGFWFSSGGRGLGFVFGSCGGFGIWEGCWGVG